jgi:hypothetical protein
MESTLDTPLSNPAKLNLNVKYQESYSRGQLLLRFFFGVFYIQLPHIFVMMFCNIWSGIISFIAWWVILFTGRYPQSFFEFNVKMMRWQVRLSARLSNLSDGYPAIGPNGTDDATTLEVPYPESLSRGLLLARTFFGFIYILIPHGFALLFRALWGSILGLCAWWVILFTGRYPKSMFDFQVGTLRWSIRLNLYLRNMCDEYPPFSGKE